MAEKMDWRCEKKKNHHCTKPNYLIFFVIIFFIFINFLLNPKELIQ